MKELKSNEKLSIEALLDGLENYRTKPRGWHWREKKDRIQYGSFEYRECSTPLKNSVPLPAAKYFDNIVS